MGLTAFDWAPMVKRGFFQALITAYVGAGLGLILFETQGMRVPSIVLIDPWLSVFCAVIAFTRVWKSIREEAETADQWDNVVQTRVDLVMDRIFEIPYLFTLTVLPFAAIAPQAFMAMLAVFYFADNYYNADLARGAAGVMRGDPARPGVHPRTLRLIAGHFAGLLRAIGRSALFLRSISLRDGRDTAMVDFFVRRSRINSLLMFALAIAAGLSLVFMDGGQRSLATDTSFLVLSIVLVVELVLEPLRNMAADVWRPSRGFEAIERLNDPGQLSDRDLHRLTAIHHEAFGADERQLEIKDMVDGVARDEGVLRLVTQDQVPVGYQYLEPSTDSRFVFLWYFAIDPVLRNGGLGGRAFTDLLAFAKEEYPDARYLLFEVHRSERRGGLDGDDIYSRLLQFYRRLGAYVVDGFDYRLPAANDPSRERSVAYRPMVVPLAQEPVSDDVRAGVLAMASGEYEDHPQDPRWVAMQAVTEVRLLRPPRDISHPEPSEEDE